MPTEDEEIAYFEGALATNQQNGENVSKCPNEVIPYDAVDFDPIDFSMPGRIEKPALSIPSNIHIIRPGEIAWQEPWLERREALSARKVNDRTVRGKLVTGILEDLQILEQASDDKVVGFIQKWGCLGISATTKESSHTSGLRGTAKLYCEETATYKQWAARVRDLLMIARSIQYQQTVTPENWEQWKRHEREEVALAWRHRQGRELEQVPETEQSSLSFNTVEEHPLYVEAAQKMMFAKNADSVMWKIFCQQCPSPYYNAAEIGSILTQWIATDTTYHFNLRDSFGQAYLRTRFRLAEPMRARFWNDMLVLQSALLPVGIALLHALKSNLPPCGICGRPVAEPRPQVKNGLPQFCGAHCRSKAHSKAVKVCRQKQKREKMLALLKKCP